jgi:hypothetical protein
MIKVMGPAVDENYLMKKHPDNHLRLILKTAALLTLFFAILMLLLIATHKKSVEMIPVDIVGYNHTDKDIGSFAVNEDGGGFLEAHHGGGSSACCSSVPKSWNPGLEVTVSWTDERDEHEQQRTVPIPQYSSDEIGDLHVHFLRDGSIKAYVTIYDLWHPNYPLKGKAAQLVPGQDPKGP